MKRWADWCALLICAVLAVSAIFFQLFDRLPAGDYIDSMARGQYDRARKFLEPEVSQGNPKAQSSLANLHYLGLGGPTDYAEAARLYHDAAGKGYGPAQLNLGHLYKQGLGVNKDVERAFGWYMHADISNSVWAEYYMRQISTELTLSPLQMATIKTRWEKLNTLVNEPL